MSLWTVLQLLRIGSACSADQPVAADGLQF
jgi:hypothetical protein